MSHKVSLRSFLKKEIRTIILFTLFTLSGIIFSLEVYSDYQKYEKLKHISLTNQKLYLSQSVDNIVSRLNRFAKQHPYSSIDDPFFTPFFQDLQYERIGNNSGYVFAIGENGKIYSHANPNFHQKHFSTLTPSLQSVMTKLLHVAQSPQHYGFIQYDFPKPHEKDSTLHHKLSYARYLPHYHIIIGSGIYLDEIEMLEQQQINEFTEHLLFQVVIMLSIILTIGYISNRRTSQVINQIDYEMQQLLSHIETQGESCSLEKEFHIDELGLIAEKLIGMQTIIHQQEEKLLTIERDKAIGETINMLAHQWRQPLNALGIMIQDVRDAYDYNEMDEQYIETFIQKSMDRIQHMSQTIDNFCTFFAPSHDKETFNIQDIISSLPNHFHELFPSVNVRYISDSSPYLLTTYKAQFIQIVHNIIQNSYEAFLRKNIQNPSISITLSHDNSIIKLSICDNAQGLESNLTPQLASEPYTSTKPEKQGKGLGLFMAKMVIERNLKGDLILESSLEGLCCHIILPYKE